jgi:hypothetical protein
MIAAVVLAALLAASPLWAPGSEPKPSTSLKHSDALALLFKNLDDRIPSTSCDDEGGPSWKGKTVGELLASRLGADVSAGAERKFSMECWDGTYPPKPDSKRLVGGWACTLYIERNEKDAGGGLLTFRVSKEPRRYLRGQVGCGP